MADDASPFRWQRKQIRLDPQRYAEPGAICSVTVAVLGHRPVFADPIVAMAAVRELRARSTATGVQVYGYCIMPDHVHLVLGPSPTCDIITFVSQFKNLTQRAAWQCGVQGAFWQKRFWDHFLRSEESVEDVVQYVLQNPVRRGLVERWNDFPYSGSLVFSP